MVPEFFIAWIAVYLVVKVCFRFPMFFHKLKNLGKRGLASIIAHRGSRLEGLPENTIAAFVDAANAGADVVELDVWLTSDGQVVVHHDESLKRMSGDKCLEKIHTISFSDLPKIEPYPHQMERCSSWVNKEEIETIPLFDDVLKKLPPSVFIIIEFKQDSDKLISEVQKLLEANSRAETVFWFSLIESINAKLRRADPRIPTITSILGMLKVLALYYLGLLAFFPMEDSVFGITVEEVKKDGGRKLRKGGKEGGRGREGAFVFLMFCQVTHPLYPPISSLVSRLRALDIPSSNQE